jgi:hypothetical protein
MVAATFVANPACDADGESHLQIVQQLVRLTGEAMGDRTGRECARMLSEDGDEIGVSVALMQENRLAHARGDLELTRERGALHVSRREIAKVVEPAFAHRDDLGAMGEPFELLSQILAELSRMVWMNPSGGVQPSWVRLGQCRSLARPVAACTSDDHLNDAGSGGPGHDGVPVAVITIVGEVDPDVDQLVGRAG